MTGLMFPKPLAIRTQRERRRRELQKNTDAVRRRVFVRDGFRCRVPGCRERDLELAHIEAKGSGGDHGLRTTTENCVCMCGRVHHRGPRDSVHSGDLHITKLTALGADGPLLFEWSGGQRMEEAA